MISNRMSIMTASHDILAWESGLMTLVTRFTVEHLFFSDFFDTLLTIILPKI